MYKYTFVEADADGVFKASNHREQINLYSADGWRFVAAIPISFSGHGAIKKFDLVFEKEEEHKSET